MKTIIQHDFINTTPPPCYRDPRYQPFWQYGTGIFLLLFCFWLHHGITEQYQQTATLNQSLLKQLHQQHRPTSTTQQKQYEKQQRLANQRLSQFIRILSYQQQHTQLTSIKMTPSICFLDGITTNPKLLNRYLSTLNVITKKTWHLHTLHFDTQHQLYRFALST